MIASSSNSGSAGNSVDYLLDGKKTRDLELRMERQLEKNADILMSNRVSEPNSAMDISNREQLIRDFKMQASMNERVKKYIQHTSISFSKADSSKVDDELMKEVASDYIKMAKLENTQYIVIKHNDTEHKHFHILANRVDNNGNTISDKFSKMKDIERCQILARRYNLTPSLGKEKEKKNNLNIQYFERKNIGKNLDRTNIDKLTPEQQAKYKIYLELQRQIALENKAKNLSELSEKLADAKISMQLHEKDGKTIGISFEADGYKFSGVQVDKQFSYSNLKNSIENRINTEVKMNINQDDIEVNSKNEKAAQNLTELRQKVQPTEIQQESIKKEDRKVSEDTKKVSYQEPQEEQKNRKKTIDEIIEEKKNECKTIAEFKTAMQKEGISITVNQSDARKLTFEKTGEKTEKTQIEIKTAIEKNVISPEKEAEKKEAVKVQQQEQKRKPYRGI